MIFIEALKAVKTFSPDFVITPVNSPATEQPTAQGQRHWPLYRKRQS
jgi:hypothetical protein